MHRPYRRGCWTALSLATSALFVPLARAEEPSPPRPQTSVNSVPVERTPIPDDASTSDSETSSTPTPVEGSAPRTGVPPSPPPAGSGDVPPPSADPSESPVEEPVTDPPTTPAVTSTLLEGDEQEDARVPPPVLPSDDETDETSYDTALARELAQLYRPANNPGRFAVAARLMFANVGGEDRVGGRMGGLQADVGQSWNSIGYGLTASIWTGRVVLDDRASDLNAMFGVGPTLNLGRRALLGRGFLDLRVGYDFFVGIVQRTAEGGSSRDVAPHGPRVQLNLGLLGSAALTQRRFFHGFGATLGYQGLVGSFTREFPYMSMLTFGFSYWLG